MAYILGLDAGSSIAKAALLDTDGRMFPVASPRTPPCRTGAGRVEADPELCREAACAVLRESTESSGVAPEQIIDLSINPDEFVVFVALWGCGKSTQLRMIAGLEQPSGGTIEIAGRDVARLHAGRTADLYADPDNIFVAGSIGSPRMNFLPATVTGSTASGTALVEVPRLGLSALEVPLRHGDADVPTEVTFGLRPEDFTETAEGHQQVSLTAKVVEYLGGTAYIYTDAGREEAIVAEVARRALPAVGDIVPFGVRGSDCFLFSASGARL